MANFGKKQVLIYEVVVVLNVLIKPMVNVNVHHYLILLQRLMKFMRINTIIPKLNMLMLTPRFVSFVLNIMNFGKGQVTISMVVDVLNVELLLQLTIIVYHYQISLKKLMKNMETSMIILR